MTSVIITYLVAFSATNMHIYHKVAIGHLMLAWAKFALQCFSYYNCPWTVHSGPPGPYTVLHMTLWSPRDHYGSPPLFTTSLLFTRKSTMNQGSLLMSKLGAPGCEFGHTCHQVATSKSNYDTHSRPCTDVQSGIILSCLEYPASS